MAGSTVTRVAQPPSAVWISIYLGAERPYARPPLVFREESGRNGEPPTFIFSLTLSSK